jgi:hypothetical protein
MSEIYVPCVGEESSVNAPVISPSCPSVAAPARWGSGKVVDLNPKTHWVDQSNLLITGALSFLASFALNSFVQSVFNLSLPPPSSDNKWVWVLYNFVYVLIVVGVALAIMYPLAKAKYRRDESAKAADRLIPTLVKCVNCAQCKRIAPLNPLAPPQAQVVRTAFDDSLLGQKPQ